MRDIKEGAGISDVPLFPATELEDAVLVELILDDGAPDNLSVFDSSAKLPALWDDQRNIWHQNPH